MEAVTMIDKIKTLYKEVRTFPPMNAEQEKIWNKKFELEFHYNSNHIEGNTLTYSETELLIFFDETRGDHTLREYEEMKASTLGLEMIKDLAKEIDRPLSELFIKNLNQVLLVRPYWKDAILPNNEPTKRKIKIGEYKMYPNSVKLENGNIFEYASPMDTPILMGELLSWYNGEVAKNQLHPVELAAMLHYKFVVIHPFDDGNGRISRLLLNYVLLKSGYPPIVIKSEDKTKYLRALHDADTGNFHSFLKYIYDQLVWSLELYLKVLRNESIEETDDWKKKLKLLKGELENRESLNEKKTDDVLIRVIGESILPFINSLVESLQEFSSLFLATDVFLKATDRWYTLHNQLLEQIKLDDFRHGVLFDIDFKEFNKNGSNPFNISVNGKFIFEMYRYSFFLDRELMFSKLYHKKILVSELDATVSKSAEIILAGIEVKLNT